MLTSPGGDGEWSKTEKLGRILLADDEEAILRALARTLVRVGYEVETAPNGAVAIQKLSTSKFDVLVSDISMPEMGGIDLLRAARKQDLDMPVLIMTGTPDVGTAILAIEFGALRYLVKPVAPAELLSVVEYAARMCRMARVKREALQLLGDAEKFVGDRAGLEAHFSQAFEGIWLAYQPIVSWSKREVYSHEALLRSTSPLLGNPGALLSAAERLGRLHDLGRTIRKMAADTVARSPGSRMFVNLHTLDLDDEELFSREAPLSRVAENVVLEITERASLDGINDVQGRLRALRTMGYRIALDDLGAGYAGLTSLAQLQPEVVKLDMSLVRDVDKNLTKQKLVGSMANLSRGMGMEVVVEGVETPGERDALVNLGCDLLQGYLFAKPSKDFPLIVW
jgi:EAL domain-containing protein (putative c-di-GMP-specific phosphodiesterase class I)/ActR/RegA family two-component response regulator